jgi:hypothetical protein
MAGHRERWIRVKAAAQGAKVVPVGDGNGGSVNYRIMDLCTAYLVDPSPENMRRLLDFLRRLRKDGHLTLTGPNGVATEAGSPGMHWSFNIAPLLAALRKALEMHHDELVAALLAVITDEVGLDNGYRFNGMTAVPCPRVKDEKDEGPIDGYRDRVVAIAIGEKPKGNKWLSDPDALAVRLMAELTDRHPEWRTLFRAARVPKLYVPIERVELEGGGYSARLVDSADARKALGRDACHRVRVTPQGIEWWDDWVDGPEPKGRVAA